MLGKIRIKVDVDNGIIIVKRGFFGEPCQFSGGAFNSLSLDEVIREFKNAEGK